MVPSVHIAPMAASQHEGPQGCTDLVLYTPPFDFDMRVDVIGLRNWHSMISGISVPSPIAPQGVRMDDVKSPSATDLTACNAAHTTARTNTLVASVSHPLHELPAGPEESSKLFRPPGDLTIDLGVLALPNDRPACSVTDYTCFDSGSPCSLQSRDCGDVDVTDVVFGEAPLPIASSGCSADVPLPVYLAKENAATLGDSPDSQASEGVVAWHEHPYRTLGMDIDCSQAQDSDDSSDKMTNGALVTALDADPSNLHLSTGAVPVGPTVAIVAEELLPDTEESLSVIPSADELCRTAAVDSLLPPSDANIFACLPVPREMPHDEDHPLTADNPEVDNATADKGPKNATSFVEAEHTPQAPVYDMIDPVSDDITAFDLPPSSLPSSSPPRMFSPEPGFDSPPSSSLPSPMLSDGFEMATSSLHDKSSFTVPQISLKRSIEAVDLSPNQGDVDDNEADRPSKHLKMDNDPSIRSPPSPKSLTPVSRAQRHKKLATPFRSPVIKGALVHGGRQAVYATAHATVSSPPGKAETNEKQDTTSPTDAELKPKAETANKDRTANAAKQFKSPLQAGGTPMTSSSSAPSSGSARYTGADATTTIKALQGKVQILKQAIKWQTEGKDEVTAQLLEKWTAVGREVAWAVWDHVKDFDPGPEVAPKSGWFADDDEKIGAKRGFDPSWGYDDGHVQKKARMEDGVEEEEEPPTVHHTLGVMLRRLAIDPNTLGWDEEEGDFVDV